MRHLAEEEMAEEEMAEEEMAEEEMAEEVDVAGGVAAVAGVDW